MYNSYCLNCREDTLHSEFVDNKKLTGYQYQYSECNDCGESIKSRIMELPDDWDELVKKHKRGEIK